MGALSANDFIMIYILFLKNMLLDIYIFISFQYWVHEHFGTSRSSKKSSRTMDYDKSQMKDVAVTSDVKSYGRRRRYQQNLDLRVH